MAISVESTTPDQYDTSREELPVERLFNRPPRILRRLPATEIEIPAPPQLPSPGVGLTVSMAIMSALMGLGSLFGVVLRSGGGSLLVSLPIVLVSLVPAAFGFWNYRAQRQRYQRMKAEYDSTFTSGLSKVAQQLTQLDQEQRKIYVANDPDTNSLIQIAGGNHTHPDDDLPLPRLWERRPTDNDFLAVRVGRGQRPTSILIKRPQANVLTLTPELQRALDLADRFTYVRDVPITVPLRGGSFGIAGPSGQTLDLVSAILCQIVVHHSPSELRIAAFWDRAFDDAWEWLRRLPHTQALNGDTDYRLLARYPQEFLPEPGDPQSEEEMKAELQEQRRQIMHVLAMLRREWQQRSELGELAGSRQHILVVIGDYHRFATQFEEFALLLNSKPGIGFSVICLVKLMAQIPGQCLGYIDTTTTPTYALTGETGGYQSIAPDFVDRLTRNMLAGLLERVAQADLGERRELPRSVRLLPLMGVEDAAHIDIDSFWNQLPNDSWHKVPCGIFGSNDADRLMIDLNEGIHGVHGMVAGTTGSGKSEFLLTFLMALAILHSPDRVNLLLIDFKGGATFDDLKQLPHTSGIVTDLGGNMTERALVAINSELDRRKREFKQAGVPNIRKYRQRQHSLPSLKPIPNLVIAIDEFDEMVREYPDFVQDLILVAKQGRSLGVHLLFATQQPSAIKEGLTRNLSYWIALRVTAIEDSKLMIQAPDAAYLTTDTPGRGFFRVNKEITQFQSAQITLPYQPPKRDNRFNSLDVTGRRILSAQDNGAAVLIKTEQKDLDLVIRAMHTRRVSSYAKTHYPIWADVLAPIIPLIDLLRTAPTETIGWMQAPIGIQDLPSSARQRPFVVDLLGDGNILMLGAAGSGKTTLLRTLMLSLAYTHSPTDLWIYTIDPSGNGCSLVTRHKAGSTTKLLHIADTLTPNETTRIERLLIELQQQIEQRRSALRAASADNLQQYRERAKAEHLPMLPAILVVIDNFAEFREAHDESLETLKAIIRDGRPCGIIFAVSAYLARDVDKIMPFFENRIALRVNDSDTSDAVIGKRFSARISPEQPGRGFLRTTERPIEFQTALPILHVSRSASDTANSEESNITYDIDADLREAIRMVNARPTPEHDRLPQPLRLLPTHITLADLPVAKHPWCIPFAMESQRFKPLLLDFAQKNPHFLIGGGPQTGKNELLRTIVQGLIAQHSPNELQFVIIDYRNRLLRDFSLPDAYFWQPDRGAEKTDLLSKLQVIRNEQVLKTVIPALTTQVLTPRSERGTLVSPRIFLLIHNCDLLIGSESTTLQMIAPFVTQGRDIGFHLIITGAEFQTLNNNNMFKMTRMERSAIYLGVPNDPNQGPNYIGITLPRQIKQMEMPPGRGYAMLQGSSYLAQCVQAESSLPNIPT